MNGYYVKSSLQSHVSNSAFPMAKRRGVLSACLIFASALANVTGAADLPKGEADSHRNLDAVLRLLRPALPPKGAPGRISYSTVCTRDGADIPFPDLRLRPPSAGKRGLDAVREIFADNKNVRVTKNRSGIMTITVSKPPMDILQTKIRRMTLTPSQRYNQQLAIVAVMHTEEFKSAEHVLRVRVPNSVLAVNIVEPTKGLPHLPATLENITVDEAFDQIARTFSVVILYATCPPQPGKARLITFDCVPLYDPLRPPWFPRD
jgi:hypothetical protein